MRHTIAFLLALAAPSLCLPDGVGGHHGDHGAGHHTDHGASAPAPATGYQQPASGYDQPSTSYDQPSTGYEAAGSTGYDQPSYASTGYEQPTSYEGYEASAPGTGYGSDPAATTGGFNLSTLLIPVLIIAGLALLFPQVVNVPVRRRREAGGGDSASNLVERVQEIYLAVVESEACMERVACQVGGIAADAGLNTNMAKMAESFMPKKYKKMMKHFNSGKDCHKIKCGVF